MIKKEIIERNRKYLFQFPEGTSGEKQEEYFTKLNKALEKDSFVAVDPKIKILPASDSHLVETEIPDPEPVKDEKTSSGDIPTSGSENKPISDKPTETNNEETGVTREKVEVEPPKKEVDQNILIDDGTSDKE